jgi:hypothetical protein
MIDQQADNKAILSDGLGREYALAVAADATGSTRPEAVVRRLKLPSGLRSFANRFIDHNSKSISAPPP